MQKERIDDINRKAGTGQSVFENVELREIKDKEIATFDYFYSGIDWGYYPDPFAFTTSSFNSSKQILYIFDELYMNKQGMSITEHRITADSAEPKSIEDFRSWGGNVRATIKGIGSREASFKWLQGLKKIVIDSTRCPHIAEEFTLYEYEIDKRTSDIMSGYPAGQPDHGIDSIRYALECVWRHSGE